MNRAWFTDIPWGVVVETNRLLCDPKGAFHGPTSDGFAPTRKLWEESHAEKMPLTEAIELCRKCHRLAPFCNYNGNTFVAIMREKISEIGLPSDQEELLRSLAGHVIAGTATPEEQALLLETIETSLPEKP